MVNHDDFVAARHAPTAWPHAVPSFDRHRQYRHVCLEREAHCARLEAFQRAGRRAASAFRKDHHRAPFAQPLKRTSNRRGVAALEREGPRAKPCETTSDDGPTKRGAPREITSRTFDFQREPEGVDVSLVVCGDDDAAFCGNVLFAGELDFPEYTADDTDHWPQYF